MATTNNQFHIVAFDPGGITGWAHLVINKVAFTSPRERVLKHILWWGTGEYEGDEHDQIDQALVRVKRARYGKMPFVADVDAISERFDLVQLVGGDDLLIPVRINAVLDYEIRAKIGLRLALQDRSLRTGITPDRLIAWGFEGRWTKRGKGKDSYAAMQHAVTWMRRLKRRADERPLPNVTAYITGTERVY